MDMHTLPKSAGHKPKSKKVGRGDGSGKGNYCTRGLKGQNARSGASSPGWFEGNQTPLFMRLPKRKGFKRFFKHVNKAVPVQLGRLCAHDAITPGTTVTKALLVEYGFLKKETLSCKIVGPTDGVISLTFEGIDGYSAPARAAIEEAGGTIS